MKIIKFPQKPKVTKLNFREDVKIPEIPFVWHTHLSDNQIKELYELLKRNRVLIKKLGYIKDSDSGIIVDAGGLINVSVDFKDLECRIRGYENELAVVCRPQEEWDILDEEEEEKEKKEKKRLTKEEKLREDCYELCENGQQFLSNAQSAEAEREFRKAIDLKLKNPDFQFFVYPETFLIYLFQRTKKIEDGLTFLSNIKKKAPKNFDNISDWSYQWVRFGQDFERTGDVANAERIYQDGIRLYPNDGEIYKRLCLMYERSGHYKDAIKFCEDAIKKGLSDGTKGGFEGRLRRILKRMR